MVAFNDRRDRTFTSVEDIAAKIELNPGDTVGRDLIDGRYLVRGTRDESGHRMFEIHEALANGRVVKRGEAEKRYLAKQQAAGLSPTHVIDL